LGSDARGDKLEVAQAMRVGLRRLQNDEPIFRPFTAMTTSAEARSDQAAEDGEKPTA
jgi:hypothetical protein